jgi:hypothetical protein
VAHPADDRSLDRFSGIRFVQATPLSISPELGKFLGLRVRSLSGMLNKRKGISMTQGQIDKQLPENRRKEIFLALVDAQDHEMDVAQSRRLMAQRFGMSESQVRQVEREGIENQWPPLE